MGFNVRLSTEKIYNAYLVLGLLEMHSNTQISLNQILGFLEPYRDSDREQELRRSFSEREQVRRLLKLIQKWLSEGGLDNAQIQQLIVKSPRGVTLSNQIPDGNYKDFVGAFLFLSMIEDDKHKENLEDVCTKEGEKALSIMSKINLAKRARGNRGWVNLQIFNPPESFEFRPTNFTLSNNTWMIEGRRGSHNASEKVKIMLNNIKAIELHE